MGSKPWEYQAIYNRQVWILKGVDKDVYNDMTTCGNHISFIRTLIKYSIRVRFVKQRGTLNMKEITKSSHFPFLHWLRTLAGYQFLSPHLAITVLPIDTEDVEVSGLRARWSRAGGWRRSHARRRKWSATNNIVKYYYSRQILIFQCLGNST